MGQTYRGHHRADCVQSRVRQILGGSPTGLAESSSLSLRTGHSSQVALHLVSRQRSYHFRLQAGNGSLDGTFTRQFKRLHRRTRVRCADQESLRSAQRTLHKTRQLLPSSTRQNPAGRTTVSAAVARCLETCPPTNYIPALRNRHARSTRGSNQCFPHH